MYSLNRRIDQSNVTVNSLHPGVVDSGFTKSFTDDFLWTWKYKFAKLLGNVSLWSGCYTHVFCILLTLTLAYTHPHTHSISNLNNIHTIVAASSSEIHGRCDRHRVSDDVVAHASLVL